MKNILLLLVLTFVVFSCVTTSPSGGTATQSTSSTEMEAKRLTTEMKTVLGLDNSQEEKVLMVNVVNLSVLKKLRETNQTDQISATREKYRNEIKGILNESQFSKFLESFRDL